MTTPTEREISIETAIRLFDLQFCDFKNREKIQHPTGEGWQFNFGCWSNGHLWNEEYWEEFIERVKQRNIESQIITVTEHDDCSGLYLPQKRRDKYIHLVRRELPIPWTPPAIPGIHLNLSSVTS